MANSKVCSIAFRQALQEKLGYSPEDVESLRKEYFKKVKEVQADYNKYKSSDAYDEAIKQMLEERKIKNIVKRRQAYMNATRRLAMEQYFIQNYPNDYATGTDRYMQYIGYMMKTKESTYMADLQKRLTGRDGFGEDYSREFARGQYDSRIYTELYYMDNPEAMERDAHLRKEDGSFTGDPIAFRLAEIVYKMQRMAVQDAIDAGADIGLIHGYMVKQTHSQEAFLSTKYGKTEAERRQAWKDFILPRLDMDKTFGDLPTGMTPDMVLDAMFDNITLGEHLKYMPEEITFVPGKNITKKAAAERKLFFKDGQAAYEYNVRYGSKNLREALISQLISMANTSTLLNYMGTNPRYNFETVFRALKNRAREEHNIKNLEYFKKGAGAKAPSLTEAANNQLSALLGEDRIPGDVRIARVNSIIRAMNNVSYLGGSLITAFMDLASSPVVAHLQGRGYLGAYLESLHGLAGMAKDPVYRQVLESIGFVSDAFIGQITEKYSGEVSINSLAAKISNRFFQLNGLRLWTDSLRGAHTIGMARDLATMSKFKYSELNVNMQDFLRRFNVSEKEWDIYREHGIKTAVNGQRFMLNEAISEIPDNVISKLYDIRMEKLADDADSVAVNRANRIYKRAVDDTRNRLAMKLRTLLTAAGMETVLLPTVTELGTVHRGLAPGTPAGEAIRHIGQFKQFPLALYNMILKGIAREAREAGPMEAIKTGSIFMVGMIATAYISMTIKDLLNNRTPRDITDPKVLAEVVVRSGALSLYGDLLLNDNSRSQYEIFGTMAGPTLSTAGELAQIASKAMFKGDNVADDLAKFAIQRTPAIGVLHPALAPIAYTNLFYLKPILNYYVYDGLNELLNPGYNDRTRSRLIQQGRDYFVQPQF